MTDVDGAPAEDGIVPTIQGGRERGIILHKLIEEVLTGETAETAPALVARAETLIRAIGRPVANDPRSGLVPCRTGRLRRSRSVAAGDRRSETWLIAGVSRLRVHLCRGTGRSDGRHRRCDRFRPGRRAPGGCRLEERCRTRARDDRALSRSGPGLSGYDRNERGA